MRRKLFNQDGMLVDEDGNAIDYIRSAWDVRRWMYPPWKEKPVSQEMTLEIKTAPIKTLGTSQLIFLPDDIFINVREIKSATIRDKERHDVSVLTYSNIAYRYDGEEGLYILRQLEAHCNPAMLIEPAPTPYPFGPVSNPHWDKLSALAAHKTENKSLLEWAAEEIERLRAKCLRAGLGA
jgi:hypothetical protein